MNNDLAESLDRQQSGPAERASRHLVPRTDVLLADPRLTAAATRLGRSLVKAAVSRAQQRYALARYP
jgi:hypothetical protein